MKAYFPRGLRDCTSELLNSKSASWVKHNTYEDFLVNTLQAFPEQLEITH